MNRRGGSLDTVAKLVKSFGRSTKTLPKVLTTFATGILVNFAVCANTLFAQAPLPSKPERPNVLFIAIDDLRPALGCYGDPLAKSPNIDQFAKSARQFNRAYVQQAVCGPSRTSLLTGLLPDHTQVWHNRNRFRETRPDHVTLPQLFKQNDYRTLGFGKIFSGNEKELDPVSWSEPEALKRKGWKNYVLPRNHGKEKKQTAYEVAGVADDAYSIRTKTARYTRWIDWQSRETIAEELYDYSGPQTATLHAGHLIEQQNIAASHPDLLQRMNDQMDGLLASRRKVARE